MSGRAATDMPRSPGQLVLDLPHRPALGRDDFIVTATNHAAVAAIDRWPDWPHHALIVTGPAGSGKSHLAAVWCQKTGAAIVDANDLKMGRVPALLASGCLVVEAVDRRGIDEQALFHAFNLVREQGGFLLMTARDEVSGWSVSLNDLRSRLRATPVAQLGAPDDLLLKAVLIKLFADRQLAVSAPLVDYLVRRMERSLEAAARIVEELDRAALASNRPLSRALATEVLKAGSP